MLVLMYPPLFPATLKPKQNAKQPTAPGTAHGAEKYKRNPDKPNTHPQGPRDGTVTGQQGEFLLAKKPLFNLIRFPRTFQGDIGAALPLKEILNKQGVQPLPRIQGREICMRFTTNKCGCRFPHCNKIHLDADERPVEPAMVPSKQTTTELRNFIRQPVVKELIDKSSHLDALMNKMSINN